MTTRAAPLVLALATVAALPATPAPRADQSIGFRPLRTAYWGDPDLTLEATASSGLPVTFVATGDCRVDGARLHLLSAGNCVVTARQPGDESFNPAADVDQRLRIEKAGQVIEVREVGRKVWLDPDFDLETAATSGLPVVFVASGDCDVNGSTVHILGAGTCQLTAHQPGDSNYTAAPIVDQEFAIARADQELTVAPLPGLVYSPADVPLRAVASSGLPVQARAGGACVLQGSILLVRGSGVCTVTVSQPGDRNFNPAASVTRIVDVVRVEPEPAPGGESGPR